MGGAVVFTFSYHYWPHIGNDASAWTIRAEISGYEGSPQCDWQAMEDVLGVLEASVPNAATDHEPSCAADPCNTYFGNFWETTTDVELPGRGPGLRVERTYDTTRADVEGPLGHGWRHGYEMAVVEDGPIATVFQENGAAVPFLLMDDGSYRGFARTHATLERHGDDTWTFVRRDAETFDFDAAGRLTEITDRNGHAITLAYDGEGFLATATDGSGRILAFEHEDGRLVSVTDPLDRTVSYDHDIEGDLVAVTDLGGGVTTYGYDGEHRVTTKLDPNQQGLPAYEQQPVTNSYDQEGRVEWQEDRLGGRTTFGYQPYGDALVTEIVDPNGNVRLDVHDAVGRRTSVIYAAGTADEATWSFEHDPATFGITKLTDPNGEITMMDYDDGNLISVVDPLERETTFTYNDLRQPLTVTDPSDVTSTFSYDASGNLLSSSRPLVGSGQDAVTTYAYDGAPGDVTSITDPSGRTIDLSYDAHGHLVEAEDAAGITTWDHDLVGRLTSFVPPNGNADPGGPGPYERTFTTNAFGDVTLEAHPAMGRETVFDYDANRNVVAVTDPEDNTTSYDYDADDRLVAVVRPDTSRVETEYDANGNVVVQRDGAGAETAYAYDAHDRLVSEQPPVVGGEPARVTSFGYDAAGRLVTVTDPESRVTSYGYDDADQVTDIEYSDTATPDVSFGYDELGRRTSMVDGSGTWSYTYDSLSRLTASTHDTTTVSYGYDLAGRLTGLTYPGDRDVVYDLDAAGRVIAVTDWLENESVFGWDPSGNLVSQVMANGVTTTKDYDAADGLVAIEHANSGGTLAAWEYTRNDNGYLASADPGSLDPQGVEPYAYTVLGQLEEIDEVVEFAYDAADNLVELMGATQVFDEANRLTEQTSGTDTTTFGYDEHGNRITTTPPYGLGRTHHYDQAHRLVEITGDVDATYTYNGDGLRTTKTVDTDTSEYTWDLAGPLPMLLSDGERDFVYGPDGRPLAHIDTNDDVTWYSHDQIGSTRLLTDVTGTQSATYRYGLYGAELDHTGTATTPLRFAGEYADDETGYQYLRARYYDPTTGQFLTRDPIETLTREPYSYASNNPLNYTDPSGHLPVLATIAIGAAIGAALDLGIQAGTNRLNGCDPFDTINWTNVAIGGAIGTVGATISIASKPIRAAQAAPRTTRNIANHGSEFLDDAIRSPVVRPDLGNVSSKVQRQMGSRGWTSSQINEAVLRGRAYPAVNKLGGANTPATRYVHPQTGQSVVVDNATGQVIHVGRPGFRYG